jgi:hypothetical protein
MWMEIGDGLTYGMMETTGPTAVHLLAGLFKARPFSTVVAARPFPSPRRRPCLGIGFFYYGDTELSCVKIAEVSKAINADADNCSDIQEDAKES